MIELCEVLFAPLGTFLRIFLTVWSPKELDVNCKDSGHKEVKFTAPLSHFRASYFQFCLVIAIKPKTLRACISCFFYLYSKCQDAVFKFLKFYLLKFC